MGASRIKGVGFSEQTTRFSVDPSNKTVKMWVSCRNDGDLKWIQYAKGRDLSIEGQQWISAAMMAA